jgi:outer membrane protein assembly factor BamB
MRITSILFIAAFLILTQGCNKPPNNDSTPTNPPNPLNPTPVTPANPVNTDSVVAIYTTDPYHLFAFDGKTGIKKWGVEFADYLGYATPGYLDGKIFIRDDNGKLYAIDTTGKIKWTFKSISGVFGNPMGANGIVYVLNYNNGGDPQIYAFDPESGQIRWQNKVENSSGVILLVKNGLVYTGSGPLTAFDAITGTKKWSFPTNTSDHFFVDDKIYTLKSETGDSYINIHDSKTGALIRKLIRLPDKVFAMSIGNGFVYVLRDDYDFRGKITAYDTTSLLQKWSSMNEAIYSGIGAIGPIIADSLVIFGANAGIYAYNGYTGTKVWEPTSECIGGTYVNNTVYYGSLKRGLIDSVKLHAYDIRAKTFKWTYTMKGPLFQSVPCVVTKSGKMYNMSH